MPKLQVNAFISAHRQRYCVAVQFPDYLAAKRASKGRAPQFTDGKTLPTPNQVIGALLRQTVEGDYTIRSHGALQVMMFGQETDANAARNFHAVSEWNRGDGKPCTMVCTAVIEMERHIQLAKNLNLLWATIAHSRWTTIMVRHS